MNTHARGAPAHVASNLMQHRAMLLALLSAGAYAQATPDAGSLLQQIEGQRKATMPRNAPPLAPAAGPPMQGLAGPTVTVTEFRFSGNRMLTSEALAASLNGLLNHALTFAELQNAALTVANLYRQAGWIVRAYVPRQEIVGGVVTIQVIEAVFGSTRVEGNLQRRIALDRALATVEAAQPSGAPVYVHGVDRAILLINDLPGVTASGSLLPGQQDAETDLVLTIAYEPYVVGEVGADNAGSRSTGGARITGAMNINGALRTNEQVAVGWLHSSGSDYLRLAANLPMGYSGWRTGLSISYLHYRLVAPEFQALDGHGTSTTAGLDASYPLVRTRVRNLYLNLRYDHKKFSNQASGVLTSRYGINEVSAGVSSNTFDYWGGGGANTASFMVTQGELNFDNSPNEAADAITTRTAGAFTKVRYGFSRQQRLSDPVTLYGAFSGQAAGSNLDSSEKFYLGGIEGVRAYPNNEGGGASGQLVNLELRRQLPGKWLLTGFFDWGQITVNRHNNFSGANALNGYSLAGYGAAVVWGTQFGLNVRAILARRLGNNANPTATGMDQDGSLTKNRLWVQASLPF